MRCRSCRTRIRTRRPPMRGTTSSPSSSASRCAPRSTGSTPDGVSRFRPCPQDEVEAATGTAEVTAERRHSRGGRSRRCSRCGHGRRPFRPRCSCHERPTRSHPAAPARRDPADRARRHDGRDDAGDHPRTPRHRRRAPRVQLEQFDLPPDGDRVGVEAVRVARIDRRAAGVGYAAAVGPVQHQRRAGLEQQRRGQPEKDGSAGRPAGDWCEQQRNASSRTPPTS